VDVARYNITEGATRTPDVPDVPYLDVVATANQAGDKLTLFVINRHLSQDISASISLSNFRARSATAAVLSATDIYQGNDDANPQAVVPRVSPLAISGPAFSHVFGKSSVSVIEVR
jgi:alpha-L-arabinofuranosidase